MYEDSAFEIDVEIGDYELKLQMKVIDKHFGTFRN
jgi:hypothetical protein